MDFFERLFHVAPDGGSGLTELALLLVSAVVAAGIAWVRRARKA